MNTIVLKGLDGGNPLHFLAALGVLRISSRIEPDTAMAWVLKEMVWHPVLTSYLDEESLARLLTGWLNELSRTEELGPDDHRRVRAAKKQVKDLQKNLKGATKIAAAAAKARGLRGADKKEYMRQETWQHEEALNKGVVELETAQANQSDFLGAGIAHLGDVIAVAPAIVRKSGEQAVSKWAQTGLSPDPVRDDGFLSVGQLSAVACDGISRGGKVQPTRFSFGNGSGGQCLLKDWRALAYKVAMAQVHATLFTIDSARFEAGLTNLNWDPAADRSYALNWWNPEDKKNNPKQTDVAANALAYIGLGLLTAAPVHGRLVSVGWGPMDGWTWPIWRVPCSENVVRSLLAWPGLMQERLEHSSLVAMGVAEVRRSRRIDPTGQGRPYFTPSVPA